MHSKLTPIILFVYNRLWHTQQTVEALQKNLLASESELFIYADGAKTEKDPNVAEVRAYLKTISGFKSVTIVERNENWGLANNIIDGVTTIVNKHGKIIVLEDDIVTSVGFLKYMNDALSLYENTENVFSISGYMYPHKKKLHDTFFYNVPLCWGWSTWKRAWAHFNKNTEFLYNYFEKNKKWKKFNAFGGEYLKTQLIDNLNGKINTWFIKWHASVMIENGLTLFPALSLVQNIGFDSSGEHCNNTNIFRTNSIDFISIKKTELKINSKAKRIIIKFYRNTQKLSMKRILKMLIPKKLIKKTILFFFPKFKPFFNDKISWNRIISNFENSRTGSFTKLNNYYRATNSEIGDYTYIAENSKIYNTEIGKFCSIGPNFLCGYGIHPTNGLSTNPMFYSSKKQNGMTLSNFDKIEENKPIKIGNDVFIGANVVVLDGITIGDGAIIGAGAVVSKNIPDFAIAVGTPIQIKKYRFNESQIEQLKKIKWWDFEEEKLQDVEKYFFDVNEFINKYIED